ncbi:MAG: hypothetical protein WC554_18720 [Clostridia bacterium]|jgi:hypothetical protein
MKLSELESIQWMDEPKVLQDIESIILHEICWLFDAADLKVIDSSLIYSIGNSINDELFGGY